MTLFPRVELSSTTFMTHSRHPLGLIFTMAGERDGGGRNGQYNLHRLRTRGGGSEALETHEG